MSEPGDPASNSRPSGDGPVADLEVHTGATPGRRSPWVAVWVTLIGSYAVTMNVNAVGIALPAIDDELGSRLIDVDWVVTSLVLGILLAQPGYAWLADRWGRRAVYLGSLSTFGVGSLICATAPTMTVLIAGRLVQGAGSGMIVPVATNIVFELFPPERRGTAVGIWGVGAMAGPAAGPPVGGWLTDTLGWRSVFVLFAVVAALGTLAAAPLLEDSGYREARRIDIPGWTLLATFVVALVMTSREAPEWGLASSSTLIGITVTFVSGVLYVRGALRRRDPVIDLRILRVPAFALTMLVVGLMQIAQLARLNLLPIELQLVKGLTPSDVGLLLAPAAAFGAIANGISGWLTDRVGARVPMVVGLLLLAASNWGLAQIGPETSNVQIAVLVIVIVIGVGMTMISTIIVAMASLPPNFVAQASSARELIRQFIGALGFAVFGALLVADLGAVAPDDATTGDVRDAYSRIFVISAIISALAAVSAIFLKGERQDQQADRRPEPGPESPETVPPNL